MLGVRPQASNRAKTTARNAGLLFGVAVRQHRALFYAPSIVVEVFARFARLWTGTTASLSTLFVASCALLAVVEQWLAIFAAVGYSIVVFVC